MKARVTEREMKRVSILWLTLPMAEVAWAGLGSRSLFWVSPVRGKGPEPLGLPLLLFHMQ